MWAIIILENGTGPEFDSKKFGGEHFPWRESANRSFNFIRDTFQNPGYLEKNFE